MKLSVADKKAFIAADLYYELRCLLGAATVWQALKNTGAGFDVVVAMDSAFVHARCLFEFFTSSRSGHDLSITEFGPSAYMSLLYETWREPLNRHVLHISKGRTSPSNVQSGTHLNEQVLAFSNEILQVWMKFENDPAASDYSSSLKQGRLRAIQDALNDASDRVTPLF